MAINLAFDASEVGRLGGFSGYFTQAWYLRKQPEAELADRLGYEKGRLSDGWLLLFALAKPLVENFEFGGYTHLSGSRLGPPALGDARMHVEESLSKLLGGATAVSKLKEQRLRELELSGHKRLAKVIPKKGGNVFPAGSGIFQCRMKEPISCKIAAWIPPGGVYDGDYK